MKKENVILPVLLGAGGFLIYDNLAKNNESNARSLVLNWISKINSGDIDKVVNLYTEDAVLVPTVSPINAIGKEDIRGYMQDFLSMNPQGTLLDKQFTYKAIGGSLVIVEGFYNFYIAGEQEGDAETVKARFTFVFKKTLIDPKWSILSQHSSESPVI